MKVFERSAADAFLLFKEEEFLAAEGSGRLAPATLSVIYNAKLFKLFVPEEYGGLGLSLPEVLDVEQRLAALDGSLGWTVTLCAGAALFCGYLSNEVNEVFSMPADACWGGSGAPGGTAQLSGDEYLINGEWNYATGAPHCTAFTANCYVLDEQGRKLSDENGLPLIRSFVFSQKEVVLVYNWRTSGMQATGSHGFKITNQRVPKDRCFLIDPSAVTRSETIYRYPFLQLAECTLAVNFLGMALHFTDEVKRIFSQRGDRAGADLSLHDHLQDLLQLHRESLARAGSQLSQAVKLSWTQLEEEGNIHYNVLKSISEGSRDIRRLALSVVHDLYPHCGINAAVETSPVNRIFRDIHTASQHSLLLYPRS